VILKQPEGGAVDVGDFTFFEVLAEGTEPLSYQWLFEGAPIPGETNVVLTLVNITTPQAGRYSVAITNQLGGTLSQPATLVVLSPPMIALQPESRAVLAGSTVTFTVEVVSAPPLFYQWRHNGEFIEGATNSFHTINNVQPVDAGDYSVLVAGPEGLAQSEDATLSLLVQALSFTNRFTNRVAITAASGLGQGSNGGANRETSEPLHAGVRGGSSVWITWIAPSDGIATFTTRGSSFDTLLGVYRGTNLNELVEIVSDDDGAGFYTSFVRFNAAAGTAYQVAVDGVYGQEGEILLNWTLDTSGARLPVILAQPQDAIVAPGATAIFTLTATNPPPLPNPPQYRWYFNGNFISGATNNTLAVSNVSSASLGLYFAEVINATESILSAPVVIQINQTEGSVDASVSARDKFADLTRPTGGLALRPLSPNPKLRKGSASVARGFTGTQVFSTVGSTVEAGEPNHCNVLGGASQWFSYQPPADGRLTINTDGSDFDTVLAVYTGPGTDFGTLVEVACDNDSGSDGRSSRLQFAAKADTLYFIVVDGVRGATGTAQLNYTLSAPTALRAGVAGDQLRLLISGPLGRVFTLEASTNLLQWETLLITNGAPSSIDYTDPLFRILPQRFYRGVRTE
jgi:hypothetical protein